MSAGPFAAFRCLLADHARAALVRASAHVLAPLWIACRRRSSMKVPRLGWLQDPWSPVGYAVVELEDEAAPPNRPPDRNEIPQTPRSPLGYRVVELAPPPAPEARRRPTKPARAERERQQQQRRRGWAALAAGGARLVAIARVLVLAGVSARAFPVLRAKVPAQDVTLTSAPAAAPEDLWPADRQGADRQTFGTAVEFV